MFWALILEPWKRYSQYVKHSFHVSMASLDLENAGNDPIQIMVNYNESTFLLCTLQKNSTWQVPLDINFEKNTEVTFMCNGEGHVHLTGYILTSNKWNDIESSSEEEEEEEEQEQQEEVNTVAEKRFKRKATELKESKNIKKAKRGKQELNDKGNNDMYNMDDSMDEEYGDVNMYRLNGNNEENDENDDNEDEDESEDEDKDEDDENENEDEDENENDEDEDDANIVLNEDEEENENEDKDEDEDEDEDENEIIQQKQQQKQKSLKAQQIKNQRQANQQKKQQDKQKKINWKEIKQEQSQNKQQKNGKVEQQNQKKNQFEKKKYIEGGMQIEDIKIGIGAPVKQNKLVTVYYVGRCKIGKEEKKIDSCLQGNGFKFRLGKGEVIKGWDVGIVGMKVGGKRRLIIPPNMGYGAKGSPPTIPSNSTLVFDIELKNID